MDLEGVGLSHTHTPGMWKWIGRSGERSRDGDPRSSPTVGRWSGLGASRVVSTATGSNSGVPGTHTAVQYWLRLGLGLG